MSILACQKCNLVWSPTEFVADPDGMPPCPVCAARAEVQRLTARVETEEHRANSLRALHAQAEDDVTRLRRQVDGARAALAVAIPYVKAEVEQQLEDGVNTTDVLGGAFSDLQTCDRALAALTGEAPKRCRIYDTACVSPHDCDAVNACRAGDTSIPAATPPLSPVGPSPTAGEWLIVAAHLSTEGVTYFWGPKFSGYTRDLSKAGRYTGEQAKGREVWSERMEVAVTLSEAQSVQHPAVCDDHAHAWFRRRFPGPKPEPTSERAWKCSHVEPPRWYASDETITCERCNGIIATLAKTYGRPAAGAPTATPVALLSEPTRETPLVGFVCLDAPRVRSCTIPGCHKYLSDTTNETARSEGWLIYPLLALCPGHATPTAVAGEPATPTKEMT